jgi:hypothetical protein
MMNHHDKKSPIQITLSSDDETPEVIMEVSSIRHHMHINQQSTNIVLSSSTHECIDLCSPSNSSISSFHCFNSKSEYIPQTLTSSNQNRQSLLPTYPVPTHEEHPKFLLLTNVPNSSLSTVQYNQRQRYIRDRSTSLLLKHDKSIPSSLNDHFTTFYEPLVSRLNIDWKVLDCNYVRLNKCLYLFANERMHRLQQTPQELKLMDNEKLIAMEFFLQMDVDLFYMKTFASRHVRPSMANPHLFCQLEPELRFSMQPCNSFQCEVCTWSNQVTERSRPCINFAHSSKFRFLNGYETILNAPATCRTNGIIYVLRCPCGEVEYIGESNNNLHYTLNRHRVNGQQIMHLSLIVNETKRQEYISSSHSRLYFNEYDCTERFGIIDTHLLKYLLFRINRKSGLQLYRHSTQCSVVIKLFLKCYPHYWMFVPVANDLTQQHDTSTTDFISTTVNTRTNFEVERCLQNIPSPPYGYQFTEKQRYAQFEFFKHRHDLLLPNLPLNLYDACIIAVREYRRYIDFRIRTILAIACLL